MKISGFSPDLKTLKTQPKFFQKRACSLHYHIKTDSIVSFQKLIHKNPTTTWLIILYYLPVIRFDNKNSINVEIMTIIQRTWTSYHKMPFSFLSTAIFHNKIVFFFTFFLIKINWVYVFIISFVWEYSQSIDMFEFVTFDNVNVLWSKISGTQ